TRVRDAGLRVFEDEAALAVGGDWKARTETVLHHSRMCLLCLGPDDVLLRHGPLLEAVASTAQSRGLRVVPVLLPGASGDVSRWPSWLASLTPLDLREDLEPVAATVAALMAPPPPSGAEVADSPSAATEVEVGAPYPGARPF